MEITTESIKCAAQHIKAFHSQAGDERKADFGEPCADCELVESCKFDWFTKLKPLFEQSNTTIHLCKQVRLREGVWISRKKLQELERRIADLEERVSIGYISEQLADEIRKSMEGCNSNKEITPKDIEYLQNVAEKNIISALTNHMTSEQK